MENALARISKRYSGLSIHSDELQTRLCMPIASDQIIFNQVPSPAARAASEVMEVVEATLGGKFQLPVEVEPEKALEPASGRTVEPSGKPLAVLEIWQLEPGSFDLVLKVPNQITRNEPLINQVVNKFVDHAREISRVIDNLDLLRFQSGPSLSLRGAIGQLNRLERECGTRLDTESLLTLLNHNGKNLLN